MQGQPPLPLENVDPFELALSQLEQSTISIGTRPLTRRGTTFFTNMHRRCPNRQQSNIATHFYVVISGPSGHFMIERDRHGVRCQMFNEFVAPEQDIVVGTRECRGTCDTETLRAIWRRQSTKQYNLAKRNCKHLALKVYAACVGEAFILSCVQAYTDAGRHVRSTALTVLGGAGVRVQRFLCFAEWVESQALQAAHLVGQ
jgi:hypothetical protein